VTANNGGLALGAAVAGALAQSSGADAGLWFGAVCALTGLFPAVAAANMSARELKRAPVTEVR
jgi:predicted MFS family arabinose efflux permease